MAIGSLSITAMARALSASHGTRPRTQRSAAIKASHTQAKARKSAARTMIAGFTRLGSSTRVFLPFFSVLVKAPRLNLIQADLQGETVTPAVEREGKSSFGRFC